MIYSLTGILTDLENNFIVINCAGVGYKCLTSLYTLSQVRDKIQSQITVYTYLNIRQDAIDLFGFFDKTELDCFKLLTTVSGVGPKAAIAILSQFPAQKVAMIVSSGDSKSLTMASGVGSKTAQRIVLELKDKLISLQSDPSIKIKPTTNLYNSNVSEALKALSVLGYNQNDVMPHISALDSNLSTEKLISLTLKSLGKEARSHG